MTSSNRRWNVPRPGSGALALAIAALMLTATIGADLHVHAPHGEPAHGMALRAADEDIAASCPICRLAHQVSSVAMDPPSLGLPAAPEQAAVFPRPSVTSTGIEPACSPRAPPPATCC
jgi:hypothetical protein